MQIKIESVSKQLLEQLELFPEKQYRVHSCFASGFNLEIGSRLCFVGNQREQNLPYGVRIKKEQVSDLVGKVISKETMFLWIEKEKKFIHEGVEIDLKDGKVYSSIIEKQEKEIRKEQLLDLIKQVNLQQQTGFKITIEALLTNQKEDIKQLFEVLQSSQTQKIEDVLKKWIGAGVGLTPAGDDFLCGILFFHQVINPILSKEAFNSLKKLLKEELTTDISTHFYFCAMDGFFHSAWISFYHGLYQQDLLKIKNSIYEIVAIGHSSGKDMLAGFLGCIIYFLEKNVIDNLSQEKL